MTEAEYGLRDGQNMTRGKKGIPHALVRGYFSFEKRVDFTHKP